MLSIDSEFKHYPKENYLKLRAYLESTIEPAYTMTKDMLSKKFGCTSISSLEELQQSFQGSDQLVIQLTTNTDVLNFAAGLNAVERGKTPHIPKNDISLFFTSTHYTDLCAENADRHSISKYKLQLLPETERLFVYISPDQPSGSKLNVQTRIDEITRHKQQQYTLLFLSDFLDSQFYIGSKEYTAWYHSIIAKHAHTKTPLVQRHIHMI